MGWLINSVNMISSLPYIILIIFKLSFQTTIAVKQTDVCIIRSQTETAVDSRYLIIEETL